MKKFSVVIVGGGSTYTPDMMELMCVVKKSFPLKKIVLYDIDKERQDLVGKYGEILFNEYYPELEKYHYTTIHEEAFKDIDFAFVQIRAGGLESRNIDEKIPLKYNCIGQETCGAGGLSYGIRSIPQIIELVKNIRKFSSNAWIINYSNPAAIVAEATKRIFPNDNRIVHICDMPIQIMDTYLPLVNRTRSNIEPRYYGLNHFGWFTHLYDKKTGEDVLPEILHQVVNENDKVISLINRMYNHDSHWRETFTFHSKMIQDFPYSLPNTYLQYYLYPNEMLKHYTSTFTRYDEVKAGREKRVKEYCQGIIDKGIMKGTEYDLSKRFCMDLKPSSSSSTIAYNDVHATYIIELAVSIAYNLKDIFLVLIKNDGIIPNIDSGMMLEVACRVGKNGIEPLNIGPIPQFEKGLLENQYACEKLIVDAVFEKSYQKALQSFVLNRTINDTDAAKNILGDFIEVNDFYPEFKK